MLLIDTVLAFFTSDIAIGWKVIAILVAALGAVFAILMLAG